MFVGGLSYQLTEGDILAVFSQYVRGCGFASSFHCTRTPRLRTVPSAVSTCRAHAIDPCIAPRRYGEVEDVQLTRDKVTGKSKGFAFLKYDDQRSTVLAVDNLNGYELLQRPISVDHALNYRPPKPDQEEDLSQSQRLYEEKMRALAGEGWVIEVVSVVTSIAPLPPASADAASSTKRSRHPDHFAAGSESSSEEEEEEEDPYLKATRKKERREEKRRKKLARIAEKLDIEEDDPMRDYLLENALAEIESKRSDKKHKKHKKHKKPVNH